MTVETARETVRQHAHEAGDSSMYSDADVDRAIQAACDDFLRETRCAVETSEVALVAGTYEYDLPADDVTAGLAPDRVFRARVEGGNFAIRLVDVDTVFDSRAQDDGEDELEAIGFDTPSHFECWPTPSDAGTLRLWWVPPATSWTPGSVEAADLATELNVRDDLLRPVLMYGAASYLQHAEPTKGYAGAAWEKFQAHIAKCKGRGGLGARVAFRESDAHHKRRRRVHRESY